MLVQNVYLHIGSGPADGHRAAPVTFRIVAVDHATNGRFRWSILVEYLDLPAKTLVHLRRQLGAERLAADNQSLDATVAVIQILDQGQMTRRQFEHIHEVVLHDAV